MAGSRDRSRSPHRTEPDDERWKCNNCTVENAPGDSKCSKCKLVRGKEKTERFSDDWECPKCNANNFSRRIDCYKCHARKPPVDPKHPNDWECLSCKGNNFSKRVDCFKCGEPKPRFISSGEWDCDCGALNYSRRTDCYKCHRPKPGQQRPQHSSFAITNRGGGGTGGPMVHTLSHVSRLRSPTPDRGYRQRSPLRGPFQSGPRERAPDVDPVTGQAEWMCPVCGVSNFYKRFDCYRCFEKKPEGHDGGRIHMQDHRLSEPMYAEQRSTYNDQQLSLRTTYSSYSNNPGSYNNNNNPYNNSNPGQDNTSNYRTQESPSNYRPQPNVPLNIPKKRFSTDWICQGCLGLNYSKRTDCYKCHEPKPGLEDVDVVKKSYTPGREWDCEKCGGNNFSRRVDCFKCKADKPQEYQDMDRVAGIMV